jgi:hypothetical protein
LTSSANTPLAEPNPTPSEVFCSCIFCRNYLLNNNQTSMIFISMCNITQPQWPHISRV